MRNQSLLKKADLALADIVSNGGLLSPEQSETFLRRLVLAPTMLPRIRRITMTAPTRRINKIGFATRIMRKAPASGTALSQSQRAKPSTDQVEIVTKEVIAEVRLPYDVLEDNIERAEAANNEPSNTGPGGLRQTIIEMIAEKSADDTEELLLLADTDYVNGSDQDDQDYLSMFDGYLKQAEEDGNSVNFNGEGVGKALFKAGLKALPTKYLRNRAAMTHFVHPSQEIDYQDYLSNRQTPLGDSRINGNDAVRAFGTLVVPVNHMPVAEGLFTDPRNLIYGIHRDFSLEYDKDITTRTYIIVLTARIGLAIEEVEALVHYKNIGVDVF